MLEKRHLLYATYLESCISSHISLHYHVIACKVRDLHPILTAETGFTFMTIS